MDSENHDDEFMNVLPPQTVTMARKAKRVIDNNKADQLPPSPPALKKCSNMKGNMTRLQLMRMKLTFKIS
jgi:hypothetical protein